MVDIASLTQTCFTVNFEALLASWELLTVLAILSIWLWILAVVTSINLKREKEKLKSHSITPYKQICRSIRSCQLRPKTQTRLIEINTSQLCNQTSGHVGTILILASVAPLLGLLGTVEGMIQSFATLAQMKNVESSQLTAGISKALVTTQGGLLVAIPGIVIGGILQRKAKKFRNQLQLTGAVNSGGRIL